MTYLQIPPTGPPIDAHTGPPEQHKSWPRRHKIAAVLLPSASLAIVLAGCGIANPGGHTGVSATSSRPAATTAPTTAPPPAAMTAECAQAQSIDSSLTTATTVATFEAGVSGWEAQLTAASHIPMTGVPEGNNSPRHIQVDFAEANLALFVAAEYDNPFGPHFSTHRVRDGYNTASSSLQDALNRCSAAGL